MVTLWYENLKNKEIPNYNISTSMVTLCYEYLKNKEIPSYNISTSMVTLWYEYLKKIKKYQTITFLLQWLHCGMNI